MMRRALALGAGGAIVLLLGVITVGFALAAPIGMWIAAIVRRARGRSYTCRAGWVGAVLACTLATAGVFGFALLRMPAGYIESVQQQAALRQREPSAIEQALHRVSSASAPQAAMEERTRELARSKAFVWWSTIMAGIVGAAMAGMLLGTMGWVGATLMSFGFWGGCQPPYPE